MQSETIDMITAFFGIFRSEYPYHLIPRYKQKTRESSIKKEEDTRNIADKEHSP